MIAHRRVLRFSGRLGLLDRSLGVFSPRSETTLNSPNSLSRIPPISAVGGLEDLKGGSYLHSNVAAANFNVPQILGNLVAKLDLKMSKENVCPLSSLSFRSFIHSSSLKEFETMRNSRSMNFVRGIIEGEGRDIMGGSELGRYSVEHNADIVHIKLMRNNTFVTLTDSKGNKILSASSGCLKELKAGPKASRYASEATAEHVGRLAREKGINSVVMKVNGFTFFKKKKLAIVAFREGYTYSRGDRNPIVYIEDTTRKPHNGCRLRKKRRV